MYKGFILILCLIISGCAGQQQANNELANLLYNQDPQRVLDKLQVSEPAKRDFAQFHLNLGLLQFMTADFKSAIATLSLAKREMAVLAASSVSENIGAGSVNETLRSYSGYPTDRVMVHTILALSYLFNNDIDGARVEVLQADIAMKKLTEQHALNGQLASAHLLAGIIYELLDEQSNALISYRNAADIIQQRGLVLPLGLQQALLRNSFKLGAEEQYAAYKKQFPSLATPTNNNKSQVFALYFDGVVSSKIQRSIVVPSLNGEQLIRISMPDYPAKSAPIEQAVIDLQRTQLVENIDSLVRDDLSKEYPSILLLTTTRAIAKYQLVKKADQEDSLFAALINLVTLLTEVADLRSWNMLPATIQFAYIETPESELLIDSRYNVSKKVTIKKGTKNIFLINSLSNNIFHYQQ
ncbi:COG3014 family protein [Psychromonas antarctica]|jgi:hypothetical protein|uniref:COG3014 family protein n=1 Tax=Psychromonas antarctica TaxID=67573 RepID=UPI001EE99CDD|nr:hypothetical protein [Psychromonas antarctica]MCG6201323.1 hypothetical protein [Psychromonas antarctica]